MWGLCISLRQLQWRARLKSLILAYNQSFQYNTLRTYITLFVHKISGDIYVSEGELIMGRSINKR